MCEAAVVSFDSSGTSGGRKEGRGKGEGGFKAGEERGLFRPPSRAACRSITLAMDGFRGRGRTRRRKEEDVLRKEINELFEVCLSHVRGGYLNMNLWQKFG